MPKVLESPHKIISLNVLATGMLILTTENRVYEHKDGKWTPMIFADDPPPEPYPISAPAVAPAPEPAPAPSFFTPTAEPVPPPPAPIGASVLETKP